MSEKRCKALFPMVPLKKSSVSRHTWRAATSSRIDMDVRVQYEDRTQDLVRIVVSQALAFLELASAPQARSV